MDVIGQNELVERLEELVSEGRVPHAMMLCGKLGYGGLAIAMWLANRLLGTENKVQHPDLHYVFPVIRPKGTSSDRVIVSDDFIREWVRMLQADAYFSFDEWLECMEAENQQAQIFAGEGDVLSHKLMLTSSQGGYKVCVLWLPERMHTVFANKILKLLEEPPQKTVFILVSEQPHMLLETIRSRVQRIDVKRLSEAEVIEGLRSKRGLEQAIAERIAHQSEGDWIKARGLLNASSERVEFHDMFVGIMRLAYQRNAKGMKAWSEQLAALGRERQKRWLTYVAEQTRENFAYNFGQRELTYMTEKEEAFSEKFARFINERNVIDIMGLVDRTIKAVGQNANPKMQFFDFALQFTILLRR